MIIPIAILVGIAVTLKFLSFTGSTPVRGAEVDELPGCPDSPNCVTSQNAGVRDRVEPLRFTGPAETAWQRAVSTAEEMGGRLVDNDRDGYARLEFRSFVFGFIDDLELLLEEAEDRIEVRSASRSGYSDLGVNRRRVEELRRRFLAPGSAQVAGTNR